MHRSRAYLAILLALALTLVTALPALAATSGQLETSRAKAAAARKQADAAAALAAKLMVETKRLDDQVGELQEQTDALDPKIDTASSRTNRLLAEVTKLRSKIKAKQSTIDETKARYATEQRLLSARVASSYKQGDWFYYDLLLGSSDIGDFITRTELVQRVIQSNNDIASQLADTRDQLQRAKVELDRSLEVVNVKRKEAERVEAELLQLQNARQSKVDQQEAVLGQKADLLADTKSNEKRLRAIEAVELAESNRLERELAGSGSGVFSGSMTWPVPASHRITSSFGRRICPFHGPELHPGIDIGAPSGSAIVAAGGGTVISAGWRGSYGNTVLIDHGNGVVTLYAHQVAGGISVSSGQKVARGQRIGAVGSTGNSTGPHLHFEVRVNGTPKNPTNYAR